MDIDRRKRHGQRDQNIDLECQKPRKRRSHTISKKNPAKLCWTSFQEIRIWKGSGQIEDRSSYQSDIYYSCHLKHQAGVGLLIHEKDRYCVSRWTPIN